MSDSITDSSVDLLPLLTSCPEENLLLPPDSGGGFFTPHYGSTLKNGRYEIMGKLGVGRYSTVWLVRDTQAPVR